MDLETKAYANASRLKGEVLRAQRTGDKPGSGSRTPLPENERTRSRLEEEVKSYEAKIASMREAMAELVTGFSNFPIIVADGILCSQPRKAISRLRNAKPNAKLGTINREFSGKEVVIASERN